MTLQCLTGAATGAATAIRAWALLLSTLPAYRLTAPFVETALAALAERLYSEATEVRAAAGEAIALLYDAAGLGELEGDSGELLLTLTCYMMPGS